MVQQSIFLEFIPTIVIRVVIREFFKVVLLSKMYIITPPVIKYLLELCLSS